MTAFTKELQKSLSGKQSDQNRDSGIVGRFAALDAALKRGDYEQAKQLLQNMDGYGIPPELSGKWQELAKELASTISERQQRAVTDWKKSVDALAKEAGEICLKAKSSEDLDELMVRISALQIKRLRSDNLLGQRANQKLDGLASFVDQWNRFLDYRSAGNPKRANDILRNLTQSGGGDYPVLPVGDIQRAFVEEINVPENATDAAREIFRKVETIQQLPAAIALLDETLKNSSFQNQNLRWNTKNLLLITDADKQVAQGQFAEARKTLQKLGSDNVYSSLRNELQPLSDAIAERLNAGELIVITGEKPQRGETSDAMLARVLDALKAEAGYAEMARIVSEASKRPRLPGAASPVYPWNAQDEAALAAYASASQLDRAGDVLAAINEYRRVITAGQGGKYAPTKEAEEALARLHKSNPEAFADLNGAVLEELRQIREEMGRALRMRPSMGPPGRYR